ncbi:MAG: HEAT repeat domain-containing protein [Planctomycetota bacterium]
MERVRLFCAVCLIMAVMSRNGITSDEPTDVFSQEIGRFRALLSSPLPERRLEAIQGLAYLKDPSCEDALLRMIADPSADIRREATIALGQCGSAKSIPALIALLNDPAWDTRVQVHDALCRMTAQTFAMDDPTSWEKWWQDSDPAAKEKAIIAGLANQDVQVRLRSLRALRFLGGRGTEDALLSFAKGRGAVPERKLILLALERMGTEKAMPYLVGQQGLTESAWAMGRIGGPEAEQALLKMMEGNYPWERVDVVINLDRIKSKAADRAIGRLIYWYGTITDNHRYEDLTLPPTPTQRAITNLIRRSGKADLVIELVLRELEGKAVEADIPENLKQTIEGLRKELKPGFYAKIHEGTAQALSAMYHLADDPALVPRLMPLLKHQTVVVRIYVAMTLAKLKAQEAMPMMLEQIREGYPFGDHKHMTTGLWVHGKHRWKGFLALAVGRLGTEEARKALEELAVDPKSYRDVRLGSVIGLRFIGSPASIPVLERVAKEDIVCFIRESAQDAIEDVRLAQREIEAGKAK